MGTHPIFESDFDCLTEIGFDATMSRKRPVQNDFNSLFGMPINIKKQKQKISEIKNDFCSTDKTNGTSNGTSKKKKDKSKENQNHAISSDKVDKKLKKKK